MPSSAFCDVTREDLWAVAFLGELPLGGLFFPPFTVLFLLPHIRFGRVLSTKQWMAVLVSKSRRLLKPSSTCGRTLLYDVSLDSMTVHSSFRKVMSLTRRTPPAMSTFPNILLGVLLGGE